MWYLLAAILGLFGALSTLRGLELIVFAPGVRAVLQLLVGVVLLYGAWQAVKRARA